MFLQSALPVICKAKNCYILGQFDLYHNGVKKTVSRHSQNKDVTKNSYHQVVFGQANVNRAGTYCKCEIDEVQIFDVSLSDNEILGLFNYFL